MLVDLPVSVYVIDLIFNILLPLLQYLVEFLLERIKLFFPLNSFKLSLWVSFLLDFEYGLSVSKLLLFEL